jgi:hypothetical protein
MVRSIQRVFHAWQGAIIGALPYISCPKSNNTFRNCIPAAITLPTHFFFFDSSAASLTVLMDTKIYRLLVLPIELGKFNKSEARTVLYFSRYSSADGRQQRYNRQAGRYNST